MKLKVKFKNTCGINIYQTITNWLNTESVPKTKQLESIQVEDTSWMDDQPDPGKEQRLGRAKSSTGKWWTWTRSKSIAMGIIDQVEAEDRARSVIFKVVENAWIEGWRRIQQFEATQEAEIQYAGLIQSNQKK